MGPIFHLRGLFEVAKARMSKTNAKLRDLSESEIKRLDYYASTPNSAKRSHEKYLPPLLKHTGYAYDFYRSFYRTGLEERYISYEFGDVRHTFSTPTITKSRPITENNQNSILIPLDTARHFYFPVDTVPFSKKQPKAVFRGACHQPWRQQFLQQAHKLNKKIIDCGDTGKTTPFPQFHKPFMPINQQLQNKIIISIEGNDVATNLKWAMNSNSVTIMPKPKFETWFAEGKIGRAHV